MDILLVDWEVLVVAEILVRWVSQILVEAEVVGRMDQVVGRA